MVGMWGGFLAAAGELKQDFTPAPPFPSFLGHNSYQIPPSIKKKHEQVTPTTLGKDPRWIFPPKTRGNRFFHAGKGST